MLARRSLCGFALAVLVALAGCAKVAPAPDDAGFSPAEQGPDFSWSPRTPRVGETVRFQPLLDADPVPIDRSLAWTVDQQAASASHAFTHAFAMAGPHVVSLSVDGGPAVSHIVSVVTGAAGPAVPASRGPAPAEAPTLSAAAMDVGVAFGFSWAAEPDQVSWDFGDGNVSAEPEPNHVYARPGRYLVTATFVAGTAIATASQVVNVSRGGPSFQVSPVGFEGGEPTLGFTSSGCIFFQADEVVARSCDEGATWTSVNGPLNSPNSRDPFLWVDPVTDRIFSAHLEPNGECIWIAWSDDDGESWLANPADCGPVPFADHQKLATGPRVGPLAAVPDPLYESAVYLCFNHVSITLGVGLGIHCYVSLDGGATFPVMSVVRTGSGLHGSIRVGTDGSVYVPARTSPVLVYFSRDGALTWESREVGARSGVQEPTQDPELAVDEAGRVFVTWVGADDRLRVARSLDGAATWEPEWTVAAGIGAVAFPVVHAGGDAVAVAFLGSRDFAGNPGEAPPDARWHLYVAWATDATAAAPRFFVQQVTPDPVQVGPICIEGTCADGSRNLLDFMGIGVDRQGRLSVAFADGCIGACITDPDPAASRSAAGVFVRAIDGPSLS